MAFARRCPPAKTFLSLVLLLLIGLAAPEVPADDTKPSKDAGPPAVLDKPAPENREDLKAIQQQVKTVLAKVIPCTVNVRVGNAQGSGVIVSADGYVLTAGHVSGQPGRDVVVVFADGKQVKGKTLGANRDIDSGMIKITAEGKWPFVEMGNSASLKKGQWVITTGHPGGFKPGRTPVVRLGRVLENNDNLVRTDCTLVGGDSGGPLFDMQGKVIGIHSRIGATIATNIHVPVDTYRTTWERLAKGESWGGPSEAYVGVQSDPDAKDCKIKEITPDSPAAKAGFQANDVVTKFDGEKINNFEELRARILKKKPGDEVPVEIVRGDAAMTLRVVIGRRSRN
jgi:serine protease Do